MMREPSEAVSADLTSGERQLLTFGLIEWGATARPTEPLARAMGFVDVSELGREQWRLSDEIEAGKPLTRRDWTRALIATEIAFVSDVAGSGLDWPHEDLETLTLLRGIQRKLAGVVLRRGS